MGFAPDGSKKLQKNAAQSSASSFTNSGKTGGSPLGADEDTKHAVTQRFERLINNISPDKNKIKNAQKSFHSVAAASDGMAKPPRGDSEKMPAAAPSGIALRLNCWVMKRLPKLRSHFSITSLV